MLTRIAAGLMLALLANAVPAQEAETADDAAAAQAARDAEAESFSSAEIEAAEIEAIQQQLRGVYELAGPVFLDLSTSTAPRDWMLASQLEMLLDPRDPAYSSKVRAELLRNAAAAAPDDALVQWVAMTALPSDGGKGGCSAPAGLPTNMDNLLRLESDNGLAWLPVLRHAYQNDDALGMDAALARMAAAERFDDHIGDFAKVLVQFHAEHPQLLRAINKAQETSPDEPGGEASAESFSVMMAKTEIPSYPYLLLSICGDGPQAPLEPARRAVCADLAQRLLRLGKSSDLQVVAVNLMRRFGEHEAAAEAAMREYRWLTTVLLRAEDADKAFNDVGAEWLRSGNEQQAMRTVAQARGLPLTPPPFWQPEQFSEDPDDDALDADEEAADKAASAAEAQADPSAAPAADERF